MHIAAAAARACRNPSKHSVISTISRCDVKKTYENTPLSHPKMLKICPRAHAESFQNQWFFDIPIRRGFEGNFCAHLELLQQRLRACEGHHPLQKNDTKCTSPRPPRAHVEILPNTLWFQQFQDAMSRKHMKTYDFLIQKI